MLDVWLERGLTVRLVLRFTVGLLLVLDLLLVCSDLSLVLFFTACTVAAKYIGTILASL